VTALFAVDFPCAAVKSAFACTELPGTDRYGEHMRRHLVLAAAIAGLLLIVTGCGSDTTTRRTVTAVVTLSSGAVPSGSDAADASAPASGSAAGAEPSASSSPSAAASPSPTAVSPAPFVTVDPLKVDCAAILSANDIKTILNSDIANDRAKINVADVNADIGQTGRVRCLYGLSPDKKSGQFSLALTQYSDAAAAQKQVDVTVQNETDNGAQITPVTVNGYPATVALRDGGLIIMTYDNWTMAIATPQALDPATLTAGLPKLAEAALTRVLKT
jgi:hypothetical protein